VINQKSLKGQVKMSKSEHYAKLGYAALCRAAFEVAEKARKDNVKIPIWKDGKIIYGIPGISKEDVENATNSKP
jgi:hypothetical protein